MDNVFSILIVEDNPDIAANIGDFLADQGHVADFASDGVMAVDLARIHSYDLVVLDIMLPRKNGYAVAKELRAIQETYTPIIILTAKDTLDDKLLGFEAGVDDYVIKPFSLDELYARIKAQAGRLRQQQNTLVNWGDITLDLHSRIATINGSPQDLGRTGFLILKTLVQNGSGLVSRSTLEQNVWGDSPPNSDALRSHMYALRKRLRASLSQCEIDTLHGQGYRLSNTREKDSRTL